MSTLYVKQTSMKRLLLKNGPSKGPWGTSLGIVNLHELSPVTRILTNIVNALVYVYTFFMLSPFCVLLIGAYNILQLANVKTGLFRSVHVPDEKVKSLKMMFMLLCDVSFFFSFLVPSFSSKWTTGRAPVSPLPVSPMLLKLPVFYVPL